MHSHPFNRIRCSSCNTHRTDRRQLVQNLWLPTASDDDDDDDDMMMMMVVMVMVMMMMMMMMIVVVRVLLISCYRSPWRLNFALWRLIFVGSR
jgi:hypothetical protein